MRSSADFAPRGLISFARRDDPEMRRDRKKKYGKGLVKREREKQYKVDVREKIMERTDT